MAKKFIFIKNLNDQKGSLLRIAKNDQELNSFKIINELYNIIEVTEEEWTNVVTNTKQILSYNSNNIISYANLNINISNETVFTNELNMRIDKLNKNIGKGYDSSLESSWINYKNYLISLDPRGKTNLTYPITSSIEQIALNDGQEFFHPLQLPI